MPPVSTFHRRQSKRKSSLEENASRAAKRKKYSSELETRHFENIKYLTFDGIFEGMVILGCITEIRTSYLKFSLPGCLEGTASIHDISSPYSACLQNNEAVDDLCMLFHIGQTFACKILSKMFLKSHKFSISLSIDPSAVNIDLKRSTIHKNMVLNAAVKSIEDQGYVMDIGAQIPSFIDKSCTNVSLKVGQVVQAVVSMIEDSSPVVPLIICDNPEKLKGTSEFSLSCFSPGTKVDAVVQALHSQGLLLNAIGFNGYICKEHFTCHQLKTFQSDVGIKISATVLYVHPVTHIIYLTSSKHLPLKLGAWKKWDVLDDVPVVNVSKNSVFFDLGKNIKGQAMKWELSDKKIDDLSNFVVSTVHKCRVLSIHPMDGIIRVTLKKSAFKMNILDYEELEIGQIVKAKVKKFIKGGMIVKLGANIQGLVKDIHMTDGFVKNTTSLYALGSKVTCRILFMDFSVTPYSLMLTCKKKLLNPDLPILSTYSDAVPGFATSGVVVDITSKTVLLSFFNNVQGIVLDFKSKNPEKIYYIGQVMKCHVLHCQPEKKMLRLSLKIDDLTDTTLSKTSNFVLGQIKDAIITSKAKNGYYVKFSDSCDTAFLPYGHLTDMLKNLKVLENTFFINDILSVVQFSTKRINIVTRKFSFLQAAKKTSISKNITDFQVGMIVPVAVKYYQSGGIVMDLGCGVQGFVPKELIKDGNCKIDLALRYQPYQSLMAKIVNLNIDQSKIELSTRMSDVYNGNPEYSLDVLQCYVEDNKRIMNYYQSSKGRKRKLSNLKVGSIVSAKISKVTVNEIYCTLENGLLAVADIKNCDQSMEEENLYEGVILFIDYDNNLIHLSFSVHLVKCVKAYKDPESSKVKIDQIIKCSAVFLSEDFILVHLLGHAVGTFAYLPSKKVINDEIGRSSLYSLGQSYRITIKRILGDDILGILKKHNKYVPFLRQSPSFLEMEKKIEPKENVNGKFSNIRQVLVQETCENKTEEAETDDTIAVFNNENLTLKYPVGETFTAKIIKKKEFQLNVVINDELKGRIHVTNLGCTSEGTFPIRQFTKGSELKIHIIGYSDIKCNNYFPINQRYFLKYAECVPLEFHGISSNMEFCTGENVIGFIKEIGNESMSVWLTSKQIAKLHFLHIPLCIKNMRKIKRDFKIGQAIEAQVLHKSKNQYVLSKLGCWNLYPGKNVIGIVQSVCPENGLLVKLAHSYCGKISVNNISNNTNAVGDSLLQFFRQRFIQCKVLTVDEESKICALSVLSSR